MLTSLVVRLQALEDGALSFGSGRAVHGLWFNLWKQVKPELADQLHAENHAPPFTFSPLMGLPRPRQGHTQIQQGHPAWLRVVALTEALSAALGEKQYLSLIQGVYSAIGKPIAVSNPSIQHSQI